MATIRRIAGLIAFLCFAQIAMAQAIIGGAGLCITSGSPNSIAALDTNTVNTCKMVYDSTNNVYYRWVGGVTKWSQLSFPNQNPTYAVVVDQNIDTLVFYNGTNLYDTIGGLIATQLGGAFSSVVDGYYLIGQLPSAYYLINACVSVEHDADVDQMRLVFWKSNTSTSGRVLQSVTSTYSTAVGKTKNVCFNAVITMATNNELLFGLQRVGYTGAFVTERSIIRDVNITLTKLF
jgi:hypothetical protein